MNKEHRQRQGLREEDLPCPQAGWGFGAKERTFQLWRACSGPLVLCMGRRKRKGWRHVGIQDPTMSVGGPSSHQPMLPRGLCPAHLDPCLSWLDHCAKEASMRVPAW